jgi:archaeosortase A (PGF-CTERM-specific)
MFEALVAALAWLSARAQPLGWLVVALFLAGALLERYDREYARRLFVVSWVVIAVYWLSMIHYFTFEQKSIVEGLGVIVGVPLSLYAGYLLAGGRDSLFALSRAVAGMGLFYMPLVSVPIIRKTLIETVTDQTGYVLNLLGITPRVVDGLMVDGLRIAEKTYPYESTFVYYVNGEPLTHTVLIACTGIGSMAIVAGLVAAVDAPWKRKFEALAITLPIIYVLNIARNVFISATMGKQLLQLYPELVASLFALDTEVMVSYIIADRIISQTLSVVVLIALLWVIVRRVPEVLTVVDDVVYMLTGREYDLQAELGIEMPETPAEERPAD